MNDIYIIHHQILGELPNAMERKLRQEKEKLLQQP